MVAAPRHVPTRTCVACRARRDQAALVRVVRRPDGTVMLDDHGSAEGRGAYLCADGSCWSVALKRSALERSLGTSLPAELRTRLEQGVVAPGPATTGRRAPQLMQGGRHGS